MLALPEDKYKEEFESYRNEMKAMETSISVLENINEELEKNKSATKDIKEREARMMEILGIFTAVVTFVAASVQGFTIIQSPFQAFLFMLAFATSLSSFVILILILFRGIEKLKRHWFPVLVYVLIAFSFGIALIFFSEKNTLIKKTFATPNTTDIIKTNTYEIEKQLKVKQTLQRNIIKLNRTIISL